MVEDDSDLSFVTTETLINELETRFDISLFFGAKAVQPDTKSPDWQHVMSEKGNVYEIGGVVGAISRIMDLRIGDNVKFERDPPPGL